MNGSLVSDVEGRDEEAGRMREQGGRRKEGGGGGGGRRDGRNEEGKIGREGRLCKCGNGKRGGGKGAYCTDPCC